MAVIRPFRALTPVRDRAKEVAALPYDVYSSVEARRIVEANPLSFLAIDRPETQFPEGVDMYSRQVYDRASSMLDEWQERGIFEMDERPCFYVWELTMNGRSQTGLVGCSSVDDYLSGVIRRHENTREDKEADRTRHIDSTSAQTGPVFLAYRAHPEVRKVVGEVRAKETVIDMVESDGVRHRIWRVERSDRIRRIEDAFASLDHTYIADGHHRAASAVAVSKKRRQEHPEYTGEEEFNYFLSVLFPDDELEIMDYNRVLKDLNGYSEPQILDRLREAFYLERADQSPFRPAKKGEMGFLLGDVWYRLEVKEERRKRDPVGSLDVEYLQREALEPIWNIHDPKTDPRLDFVGGIRGLGELERRCRVDCVAAFSMYPTSIQELFEVADAGLLMPPKSTWFEPKLRSGLFIHRIER